MRTLILAGSFREAAVYARARGLRHYRYASSAAAVENFAAQRVVQLPGFDRRADKHALISIAKRVERRGGEWVQDEYVPEPVEETPLTRLASFTLHDWLFGSVETPKQAAQYDAIAAIGSLGEDELRAVGATEEEVKLLTPKLTDEQAAALDAANEPKKPEPKPAAKPKRTRNDPPPPRRKSVSRKTSDSAIRLENKGAGSTPVTVPEATDSVDDLFED
jgi:hypothetical protein